jgi:hypothetical protein
MMRGLSWRTPTLVDDCSRDRDISNASLITISQSPGHGPATAAHARAAFVPACTTAVAQDRQATALFDGSDALSTFVRIITTPDGHYYKLVPLKAPPPGAASSVLMAIPEDATASVAPTSASTCRLTNFVNLEYQPQYTTVCGPQ